MTMTFPHLQLAPSGRWQYRRRVPERARSAFDNKAEFKRVVPARSEAELPRAYAKVDAEFATKVRKAERDATAAASSPALSPREIWKAAVARADELAAGVGGLDEDEARNLVAEHIAASYPEDPEDGSPVGVSDMDAMTMKALNSPSAAPPAATLADARAIYVKEHLRGGTPREDTRTVRRVDRMVREVEAALGRVPVLVDLDREDARKVRDRMLSLERKGGNGETLDPASVRRNLTTLKAVVNFAAKELGLPATFDNPFNKLRVDGADEVGAPSSEDAKRDPLPPAVLREVRARVLSHANAELALVWRLLQGTGARLGEVTGLRLEDVCVCLGPDDPLGPYAWARVTWHEGRRLKTKASIRYVPLVGDALVAAEEALKLPRQGNALFPRYAGPNGPGSASAALMKHVNKVSADDRHVVHSLRHNMKDWLRLARVAPLDQDLILGHSLGSIGDRVYGGTPAKLRATTEALTAALAVAERELR